MKYQSLLLASTAIALSMSLANAGESISPTMAKGKLCLDWNTTNNKVALYGCHGGYNQSFFNTRSSGQQRYNNLCLDAPGGRGTGLVMNTCNLVTYTQQWTLVTDPSDPNALGTFRTQNNLCANIPNGNAAQGVQVIAWDCPAKTSGALKVANDTWYRGTYVTKDVATGVAKTNLSQFIASAASYPVGTTFVPGAGIISSDGHSIAPGLINTNTGVLYPATSGIVAAGGGNIMIIEGGALSQ